MTARKKKIQWELRLYVAGKTERSTRTIQNLQAVCEAHLKGLYKLQIIDLLRNPRRAREDQILAIPTLVRRMPLPMRKLIGTLSNADQLLSNLGLTPQPRIA
jgi:circadian clock protein KaiB